MTAEEYLNSLPLLDRVNLSFRIKANSKDSLLTYDVETVTIYSLLEEYAKSYHNAEVEKVKEKCNNGIISAMHEIDVSEFASEKHWWQGYRDALNEVFEIINKDSEGFLIIS